MPEPIPIPVSNLLLDGRNPRLTERTRGQRKIIRALANTHWRQLLALAKDIVEYGQDPSDLFIVMRQRRRRYVVLDGNRRIAVLKLLENPSILDDRVPDSQLRILKRLSRQYDHSLNDEVLCILVRDRVEADHWIELKHTPGHGGAGPIRWNPEESGRFRATVRGTHTPPQTQALDFLQARGDIDQDYRSAVPTTTLGRLLNTPAVRELLGVGLRQGQLVIATDHEDDVARLLLYVIRDLADRRITVRNLDRREDRIGYAQSLPNHLLVRRQVGPDGTPATSTGPAQRSRGEQRERTRERPRLIPNDADLHIPDGRLQNIERELRALSLSQYPNAISVLFRVFLELSTDHYVERTNLAGVDENSRLRTKLTAVTENLAGEGKLNRQQAKAIQVTIARRQSVTGFHQSVHNQYLFPGPADLRAEWNTLQPWFEAVWSVDDSE